MKVLEEVKVFLESSTVHGLSYISTTRRLVRLFWICVVIGGFIGAGIMIEESLSSWANSPISTTIETLPIGEATFPLVTVCPPRSTFTNLNYDLTTVEKMTLAENDKKEMLRFAIDYIQDGEFEKILEDVESYEHRGKFRDWYFGTGLLTIPYLNKQEAKETFLYYVKTTATSGCVTSSYYGEVFSQEKFKINENLSINILNPFKQKDSNITIVAEIDDEGDETNGYEKYILFSKNTTTDYWLTWQYLKHGEKLTFEMKDDVMLEMRFIRRLTQLDLANWQDPRMTGLRFCWQYNETGTADNTVDTDARNRNFRYLVSVLLATGDISAVWRAVKEARYGVRSRIEEDVDCSLGLEFRAARYTIDNDTKHSIENHLNLVNISSDLPDEVSEEMLKAAGEMYIYLIRKSSENKVRNTIDLEIFQI